mgnify:CR=1 FL=1
MGKLFVLLIMIFANLWVWLTNVAECIIDVGFPIEDDRREPMVRLANRGQDLFFARSYKNISLLHCEVQLMLLMSR